MGLKIAEAFRDCCLLTVTATGARATLLADVTCQVYDEAGAAFGAAIVATEMSNGWYYAEFTPDAAGTWTTEWSKNANPENYTFHYPYKEFQVGAGQEADIYARLGAPAGASVSADILAIDNFVDDLETRLTAARAGYLDELAAANIPTDLSTIDALHDIPVQNALTNTNIRDVIGNKTDDPTWFTDDVSSLMKFSKAAVATGGGLTYSGKADAGMVASTTEIYMDDLKGFGDDFFNTDWVMVVNLNDNSHGASPEGDAPRDITDYVSLDGHFTVTAFGANVEAGDKIVVQRRGLHTTDVIGLKTTPATNSLAYRLSQFTASGDGDFATGTPLPSNQSLYDCLAGANGLDAWPNAAAPAANISMAEVLHLVCDRTEHHVIHEAFFSDMQASATVTAGAGNVALPSVVLPNITGTIVRVKAGFIFRMIENTGAANMLNGDQYIQTNNAAEGYDNAIKLVDNSFSMVATTKEGGSCITGNTNMQASAHPIDAFNVTVTFQWTAADADVADLVFYDIQTFLIVSYY